MALKTVGTNTVAPENKDEMQKAPEAPEVTQEAVVEVVEATREQFLDKPNPYRNLDSAYNTKTTPTDSF